MITAKQIEQRLAKAITEFGSYEYETQGTEAIMDLDTIVVDFNLSDDVDAVNAVLQQLDKKPNNTRLVADLIARLQPWTELMNSGSKTIIKYTGDKEQLENNIRETFEKAAEKEQKKIESRKVEEIETMNTDGILERVLNALNDELPKQK